MVPPGVVTVTPTSPEVPAGVSQVIVVSFNTDTFKQGLPPTETVAPARKFVPVSEICVPPPTGPDEGEIPTNVGAAK